MSISYLSTLSVTLASLVAQIVKYLPAVQRPRFKIGLGRSPGGGHGSCDPQKSPDTLGSLEGNTEGPGTASSEPLLPA